MFWLARQRAARLFTGGMDGLRGAEAALDDGRPPALLRPGVRAALGVEMVRRPALETANVLGLCPGRSAEFGAEILVVGAHHDHIGRGEFSSLAAADQQGRLHPGADDNASGVAALLALAGRWRLRGGGRRSVLFAAFGAEELGQRGSRWLLSHPPAAGQLVAMIDLNMVGRGRSQPLTIYGADSGAGLAALVTRAVAAQAGLRVQLRQRTSYRSDQWVFWSHELPALLLTTGIHGQYHRPGDVPELVESGAALRIVELAERLLMALDGAERWRLAAAEDK